MQNNLRMVTNNVADDNLTLVATTNAGSLVAGNLTNDLKSKIWRGTTLSETITLTWSNAQNISMVALPFCNFGIAATMRVKLYTNVADGTPVLDTGAVLSNSYTLSDQIGFGNIPLGVNAYYYGYGTYAVVWFASQSVKKIEVILDDSTSSDITFLEASRIVVGDYFSPSINADYGASIDMVDNSKHYRNESGDLRSDRGISYKKLTFKLNNMIASDRTQLVERMKSTGKYKSFYLSLFPESSDDEEDQIYQIYGKLSSMRPMSITKLARSSSGITIEEI